MATELLESQLPVFNGDLSSYNNDVDDLSRSLNSPDGHTYEARLPSIVGYIPESEAAALSNLPHGTVYFDQKFNKVPRSRLEAAAPRALEIIRTDIGQVHNGASILGSLTLRKRFVQEGAFADGKDEIDIHVDLPTYTPEDAHQTTYIASDIYPTQFYKGGAGLKLYRLGFPILDEFSLDQGALQEMIAAPKLAIVRITGATVHAASRVETSTNRMFVRAHSTPVKADV